MEKILDLYSKADYEAIINYGNSRIDFCQPEEKYQFLGAVSRAYYELEKFAESIDVLDRAIALKPDYSIGLRNRGLACFQQKKYESAINDFARSIATGAGFVPYDILGLSYAEMEQHEQAVNAYTLYLEQVFDEYVLAWRAESFVALGNHQQARSDWETIFKNELCHEEEIDRIRALNGPKHDLNLLLPAEASGVLVNEILAIIGFTTITSISRKNTLLSAKGIYVLEFSNEEYYVGQSINPIVRLQAHRRKYEDLKRVFFKPCLVEDLTAEENRIISFFERKFVRLRNLNQVSFSNLFAFSKQQRWIYDNRLVVTNYQ